MVASEAFQAVLGRATRYEQTMLRLFGIPESEIAETLRVAEQEIPEFERVEITTCLRRGEVEVVARREPAAEDTWRAIADLIAERHDWALFSPDGTTIDEQVARLLSGHRVALAESCTGGLIAKRVTDVAGASSWFVGGVVSYANEAKVNLLGVAAATLEAHGAVNEETAREMAEGARARFGATYALAVTGVAGPTGGTAEKPVGTTCFALAEESGTTSETRSFGGGRGWVRLRASQYALDMVRRRLREKGEKR